MSLKITGLTAAILAVVLIVLLSNIITIRRQEKILLGSGGNKLMEFRIRG
jgi:uncharacterized membrane protein YecN with MAPEG domain